MRTEHKWNTKHRDIFITTRFTPRIAEVLKVLPDIEEVQKSTYLYGPSDYGKTIQACRWLLAYYKKCYHNGMSTHKGLFVNVPDLFLDLKNSFKEKHQTEIGVLSSYRNCEFLVLDDLSVLSVSDWSYTVLYSLINHRYEMNKLTIITNNLSLLEMEEHLSDSRITSRIERGGQILSKKSYKNQ